MQLIRIGLEHPDIRYEIFYGASDNDASWWDNSAAFRFGYRPQGQAEDHRAAALAAQAKLPPDPVGDWYQGGPFCSDEFDNGIAASTELKSGRDGRFALDADRNSPCQLRGWLVLRFQSVGMAMDEPPLACLLPKNMRHPVGPPGHALDAGHALAFVGLNVRHVEHLGRDDGRDVAVKPFRL